MKKLKGLSEFKKLDVSQAVQVHGGGDGSATKYFTGTYGDSIPPDGPYPDAEPSDTIPK